MAIEMQSVINGFLEGSIRTAGREPVINELIVSENGTYTAPSDIDGYNPIKVNVPIPILNEITITSNGTYTPATELDGYNKIIVNVPLPDNAYILNTGSGPYISYNNGVILKLQNLKVNIEPIQSGSGDPSPTNVRPISGWDECNVTVADDTTTENVYTIDLDGTRYGGTLDVVSGVLTVDRVTYNVTSVSRNSATSYYHIISGEVAKINNFETVISDKLPTATNSLSVGIFINDRAVIRINTPNEYASGSDMLTAYGGSIQVVYELATPQVIQLTPTQIETLLGNNVITANTGTINNIEYFTK